jgi:hypothetical protein
MGHTDGPVVCAYIAGTDQHTVIRRRSAGMNFFMSLFFTCGSAGFADTALFSQSYVKIKQLKIKRGGFPHLFNTLRMGSIRPSF